MPLSDFCISEKEEDVSIQRVAVSNLWMPKPGEPGLVNTTPLERNGLKQRSTLIFQQLLASDWCHRALETCLRLSMQDAWHRPGRWPGFGWEPSA